MLICTFTEPVWKSLLKVVLQLTSCCSNISAFRQRNWCEEKKNMGHVWTRDTFRGIMQIYVSLTDMYIYSFVHCFRLYWCKCKEAYWVTDSCLKWPMGLVWCHPYPLGVCKVPCNGNYEKNTVSYPCIFATCLFFSQEPLAWFLTACTDMHTMKQAFFLTEDQY